MKNPHVWLVGGYGDVGLKTAHNLIALDSATVTVSGRDHDAARNAAQQLGSGTTGRALDITSPSAVHELSEATCVVSFTEAFPPDSAAALVEAGVGFVATSADQAYSAQLAQALAKLDEPDAAYVLGAGLVPGLSNVLASEIMSTAPTTEAIDIVLEMGLGRHHGRESTKWMLSKLAEPYTAVVDGSEAEMVPGELRRTIRFDGDTVDVPALGYGFVDQTMIASQHSLSTCRTFLAVDPTWVTRALGRITGTRLGALTARRADNATRVMPMLPTFGTVGTRLALEGFDRAGTPTRSIQMISRHDQSQLTAAMIAATATALVDDVERRGEVTSADVVDQRSAESAFALLAPDTRWA